MLLLFSGDSNTAHKYLFIDGQYLDRVYVQQMRDFFGDDGALDLVALKDEVGAFSVYYYQALNSAHGSATSEAFKQRLARDVERFDAIDALPGFHVRLGTTSGKASKKRKPRQKQVDIRLAVDALSHAFHKNLVEAVFLTGNLDFKPVVDALVRMGVPSRVDYDERSVAKPLYRAADLAVPITLDRCYRWSTTAYRNSHPLPTVQDGHMGVSPFST